MSVPTTPAPPARRMTWFGLVGLIVAFVIGQSIVSIVFFDALSERAFPDVHAGLKVAAVHGAGTAIVALAITWKRWWPQVLRDHLPARRWVWWPSLVLIAVAIGMADYGRIGEAGLAVLGAVALGTLMIAVGEELLFRGVAVVFLRERFGELGVALLSSLLFGLVHFPAGPVQVVFSALLGFVLYLARRVSGGLILPIAVHVAWDLSVFTASLNSTEPVSSDASFALAIANVLVVLVAAILWRRVSPASSRA
ncbi:CPBP family intramembrane glutamic endopeptidase [Demequina pelophila]|uniref:CPBP family intramembrane glutamic endopeptidase n=1 Tax=Demequina pelophila TaxID=1638984 RepID=UPI000781C67A|nr:CPBP family intramembrane glutamic endopeptidase [Demequina pelophila]